MVGPGGGRKEEGVVWSDAGGAWTDGGCWNALEEGEARGADKRALSDVKGEVGAAWAGV